MVPQEYREKRIAGLRRLAAHPGMTKRWIASLTLAMTGTFQAAANL
jgi:hypothetical protein